MLHTLFSSLSVPPAKSLPKFNSFQSFNFLPWILVSFPKRSVYFQSLLNSTKEIYIFWEAEERQMLFGGRNGVAQVLEITSGCSTPKWMQEISLEVKRPSWLSAQYPSTELSTRSFLFPFLRAGFSEDEVEGDCHSIHRALSPGDKSVWSSSAPGQRAWKHFHRCCLKRIQNRLGRFFSPKKGWKKSELKYNRALFLKYSIYIVPTFFNNKTAIILHE